MKVQILIGGVILASIAAWGAERLTITTVTGEGAFNNIKRKAGRDIVVEVRDQSGKVIPGADVTFTAPSSGPGVAFVGGNRSMKTKTDAQGRASTVGLSPNQQEGRFQISVHASFEGAEQTVSVAQSNTAAGGISAEPGKSGAKKALLFTILGGAAAGGLVFGLRGGGSSVVAPPPTGVAIGGITVGGPR